MEDSLDTSWIQEEEKIESIQHHYIREPMEIINTYFIYVNSNDSIEKIICEKEQCISLYGETAVGIHKDRVLQIIQSKKSRLSYSNNAYKVLSGKTGSRKNGSKRYALQNILSFIVDLEPENVEAFSELDMVLDRVGEGEGEGEGESQWVKASSSFLKVLPIFDEIIIPESIFIFHNINCLYFIFKETDFKPTVKDGMKDGIRTSGIKSILKYSGMTRANRGIENKGITKKVRIFIPEEEQQQQSHSYSTNTTLKNYPETISTTSNKYTRKNEEL